MVSLTKRIDWSLVSLGDEFNSADIVLILCDTYTRFCCGQDDAVRNCCSTGNGIVRLPAAEPMLNELGGGGNPSTVTVTTTMLVGASSTGSPSTVPGASVDCSTQQSAAIGVGGGLRVVVLAAGFFAYKWGDSRKRLGEVLDPRG